MYNKIEAKFDLANNDWATTHGAFRPGGCFITFGFKNINSETFDDFKFGYDLYVDNKLVKSQEFPEQENIKLKAVLTERIFEPSIDLEVHKHHRIHLWATLNGVTHQKNIIIETVIPAQPYPSWTYVNNEWKPPIPRPTAKGIWSWNEQAKRWDNMDHQYMHGTAGSATEGLI